jgi:anti-sigma regulatory factor (Ser/Thr protein kinase)
MIPLHIEQVFDGVPEACGQARTFVVCSLADVVGPDRLDDVSLATSEYAGNAIKHAGGAAFTVAICIEPKHVVVHIVDAGDGMTIPQVRPGVAGLDSEGGRGMFLAAAFTDAAGQVKARECGCTPDSPGWCCWFRIDRPAQPTSPVEVTS